MLFRSAHLFFSIRLTIYSVHCLNQFVLTNIDAIRHSHPPNHRSEDAHLCSIGGNKVGLAAKASGRMERLSFLSILRAPATYERVEPLLWPPAVARNLMRLRPGKLARCGPRFPESWHPEPWGFFPAGPWPLSFATHLHFGPIASPLRAG